MKKAFRYDDEAVFYFDAHDNKYVATGGSLAWRLNNPGLLLSHSLHRTGYTAIGAYHQYAIFSHPMIGKEALRSWIYSTKYYNSPLIEIAKYYHPNDPKEYLNRVCTIAGCSSETKPCSLLTKDFEKLLGAIQKLAGFSHENEHLFSRLPKITARFYSRNRKVEFYLAGYEDLLTKSQAIEWVETHKLDAVIVHKGNGEVYLRSRPGHHFDQIRFKQKDYGAEKEFKDAIREVGKEKEGQCIWAFINGLFNTPEQALQSATLISNLAGGEHIWYLVNDTPHSLGDAMMQKFGHHSESVKFCAQFFKMLITLADDAPAEIKPPIVVITHSQGALISNLALNRLPVGERARIRVFTLGGAAIVSTDISHPESHNYFSVADAIPRLTSWNLSSFLLQLHEGTKAGLTTPQVIAQLIQDDVDMYNLSQDAKATEKFCEQRQKYYEDKLWKVRNVTILDEAKSGTWEHAFLAPCYQKTLREIIRRYKQK